VPIGKEIKEYTEAEEALTSAPLFADPQKIADEINRHWTYDPLRPEKICALYRLRPGAHIHLQVCEQLFFRRR